MKNWAEASQKSFKKALTAENFGDILISRWTNIWLSLMPKKILKIHLTQKVF